MNVSGEEKRRFEEFVRDEEPAIEQLKQIMDCNANHLDYTPESLIFIENWTLANKKKLPNEDSWYIVRIAYYFGKVLMKKLGGTWMLETRLNDMDRGLAIIKGFAGRVSSNPLRLVNNFWFKEEKGMLQKALKTFEEIAKKNKKIQK